MDRNLNQQKICAVFGSQKSHTIRFPDLRPQGATAFAKTFQAKRSATRTEGDKLGRRSPTFEAFAANLQEELSPSGLLEGMLADLVTRAAWELKGGDRLILQRSRSRSERLLLHALDTLERVQDRRGRRVKPPAEQAPECGPCRIPYHVEGLIPTDEERAPAASEPANDEDDRWRERLMFDPDVSDLSPIVRGTWISASYLVSLIVDGWSWLDILRAHPELVEEDIRACLRFSTEHGESPADWLPDQPREAGG